MASYKIFNTALDASRSISGAADLFGFTTPDNGYSGLIALWGRPTKVGGIILGGNAYVYGASGTLTTLYGNVVVGSSNGESSLRRLSMYSSGKAEFMTGVGVSGNLEVSGALNVGGALDLGGSLDVQGNISSTGYGDFGYYGDFNGEIRASGDIRGSGIIDISGGATLGGDLTANNIALNGGELTGNLRVSGDFATSGNAFVSGYLDADKFVSTGDVTYSFYGRKGDLFTSGDIITANYFSASYIGADNSSTPSNLRSNSNTDIAFYVPRSYGNFYMANNCRFAYEENWMGGLVGANTRSFTHFISDRTAVSGHFQIQTGDPSYLGFSPPALIPGTIRISGHEMYVVTGANGSIPMWGKMTITAY